MSESREELPDDAPAGRGDQSNIAEPPETEARTADDPRSSWTLAPLMLSAESVLSNEQRKKLAEYLGGTGLSDSLSATRSKGDKRRDRSLWPRRR